MAQLLKPTSAYGVDQPSVLVMPIVQYINGAPTASTQGVLGQTVIDENTLVAYMLIAVNSNGAVWSTINEDGLQTINDVAPVDGNIEFTSTGASIAFTNPSPGVINAEAIGGGGGIGSIDGDVSSVSGAVVTFTGGTSGAVFTGDGTTTMTQSFDFLALPATTAGGDGAIYIDGDRFAHTYGSPAGINTWIGIDSGSFSNASTENTAIGANTGAGIGDGSRNVLVGWHAGQNLGASSSDNIIIGANVAADSGDDNTIRIGNPGGGMYGQSACYIAGVWGESGNLSSTQSVVIMDSNSLMAAMDPASDGQILIGATAADLAWATITPGTGISISNGTNSITISASGTTTLSYADVFTSPYSVISDNEYLSVDSSGGAITVQLPDAPTLGRAYVIKDRNGSAASNAITVTTAGGATNIDGATSFVMNTNYQSIQVIGGLLAYEIY